MDINGKVAVVTGGASGIGQAVTRRVAAAGGKVVIFDLNEEAGQAMVRRARTWQSFSSCASEPRHVSAEG